MRRFFVPAFVAGLLIPACLASAAGQKTLTFDDLMRVQNIDDPQASPDGRWIAYTVTVVDKEKNSRDSDLWILPATGGQARQLTRSPGSDSRPRWSPDSREIAFHTYRDGNGDIYLMNADGTELVNLTRTTSDEWYPEWSPR